MNKNIKPTIYDPIISIIIPFHGHKEDLLNCLGVLQKQDFKYPYQIIVIESGINKEMKEIKLYPDVVHLSFHSTLVPGAARNAGVKISKTEFLAFIDADCVPALNWISEIYSSLKEGNEIVVGPIINLFPFHPIASVDNLLQFVDFQKYRRSDIKHFPGCNFGITKSLFKKTGGFSDKFKNGEDILFSIAAIEKAGKKVKYNPVMVVRHSGRKTVKGLILHNKILGYYRGYLGLKLKKDNRFRGNFLYSFLFGLRRLAYITLRTLQWNPAGILRLIFFFPLVIVGLLAWGKGFHEGNQKFLTQGLIPEGEQN